MRPEGHFLSSYPRETGLELVQNRLRSLSQIPYLPAIAAFTFNVVVVVILISLVLAVDTRGRDWSDILIAKDAEWYSQIAREGYNYTPDEYSSVAFFPLYPILMRALTPLTGDPALAGVLISIVCFLAALVLLYHFIEQEFQDSPAAARAVFYIAAYPTAMFFLLAYTESLYLLLSLGAAFAARRRMWLAAVFCVALLSATRVVGILVAFVVIFEWLASHNLTLAGFLKPAGWRGLWQAVRADYRTVLLFGLMPSGLLAFMAYQWVVFGSPFTFIQAQAAWNFSNVGPVALLAEKANNVLVKGQIRFISVLDVSSFFGVVALSVWVWRKMGPGYALYVLLAVMIPMSSRLTSMMRYTTVLFPAFIILGFWGHKRWVHWSIMGLFGAGLVYITIMFAMGQAVG